MKKKLIVIIIAITLITILFAGCTQDNDYYIEFSIIINSKSSYTLFSPIIITDKHSLEDIYSEFKIINGDIEIEEIEITQSDDKHLNFTEYPDNNEKFPEGNLDTFRFNNYGLKIKGTGNSIVKFKITEDTYYTQQTFADFNGSGNLVYCEDLESNQTLELIIEIHIKANNRGMDYNPEDNCFNINNGWNSIFLDGVGYIQ